MAIGMQLEDHVGYCGTDCGENSCVKHFRRAWRCVVYFVARSTPHRHFLFVADRPSISLEGGIVAFHVVWLIRSRAVRRQAEE